LEPEEAFDAAFPEGVARLEEELLETLRDGTFTSSTVPLAAIGGLGRLDVGPAAPAEVLSSLGFILAHKGERDGAERHFDLALEYDPRFSGALVGLGSLRTMDRRLDEAGVWFAEAEEAGGLEAEGLLVQGRFLLVEAERAGAEGRAADRLQAVAGARSSLEAAAESFPSYVEARALLGMTYLHDGDPEVGIRQLVWARRRAPARKDLAYYLVFLYARAGELERGERLLEEQLDPVEHAQMYQRASEALEQARRRAEAASDPP
jgi:Tfp pilus assembly protein PilF